MPHSATCITDLLVSAFLAWTPSSQANQTISWKAYSAAETFPAEVLLIGNTHLMEDLTDFAWFMTVFAEANVKVIFVQSHVVPSKVTQSLDTSWRWWEEDLVYYWVCLQYQKSLSERASSSLEPPAASSSLCNAFNQAMKALLDGSWTHPDVWDAVSEYVTTEHPYLVATVYSD